MSDGKSRWVIYNYSSKGPYLVLIMDMQWWDLNHDHINEWFDLNCPICRPEPGDSIISFQTENQYLMWKMCWGP